MKILRTIVVDTEEPEHKEVVWIDTKERVVAKIYNNGKWQTVEYAEFLNFITLDQLIVVLKDYISKEELLDLLLNKIGKEHLTEELKNEIEGKQEKLIAGNNINIDELTNTISTIYEDIPDATEEIKGKAKLYKELGDNIDGSISQKVLTEELNNILLWDDVLLNN